MNQTDHEVEPQGSGIIRNRPALKVLIPYVIGIVLADRLDLNVYALWILVALLIAFTFTTYKVRWLSTSSVLLAIAFLAIGFMRYEIDMIPPRNLDNVVNHRAILQGTVVESQKERSGGSSLIIKGKAYLASDPSVFMKGKVSIRSWQDESLAEIYGYGDIIEIEGRLTQPRKPTNPSAFDYGEYLRRSGIFATMTIEDATSVNMIGRGGSQFLRWVRGFRERIEYIADEITSSRDFFDISRDDSLGILKGVILGDRAGISQKTYSDFRRTNTTHILVVSGTNFAIVAGWTFLLFNGIRKLLTLFGLRNHILESRFIAYLPIFPIIFIYACMVGFEFSVIRAFIFIVLFIISVLISRDTDIFNNLAMAGLYILVFSPGAIWDAGFRLSFGAVASITYLIPYWNRLFKKTRGKELYRRAPYWILQGIAVSISAQIGAGIITAYTFKTFSPSGFIANCIIFPLVAIITPIGFASCIIGLVSIRLAELLGYINHLLLSFLISNVKWFSQMPHSLISVRWFSFFHVIVFLALIIFAVNFLNLLKDRRRLLITSYAVMTLIVWAFSISYDGHVMEVTYLDVGNGDSIFLDFPNGRNILIDGGSYSARFDNGKSRIEPFLTYKGITKLDLVVSTHPHNDHAGGLTYTVDNFVVGEVITGSYGHTTPTFDELCKRLKGKNINYRDAQVGTIFDDGDTKVEVLSPIEYNSYGTEDYKMNNNSVVLRIIYKGVSFLFASDIQKEAEYQLINSRKDISATVLKVPHQGSKTSSTWEFLRAVQPSIGVVSVGRYNLFRHPSPMIMGRYRWLGIKTYRTDTHGAIRIITDGRHGWIKTMKP